MSRRNLIAETGIWFGTRGSEVQILSPRQIFSITYSRFIPNGNSNVDENVAVKASEINQQKPREVPTHGYAMNLQQNDQPERDVLIFQ